MKDIRELYNCDVPEYDIVADDSYEIGEFSRHKPFDGITIMIDSTDNSVYVDTVVDSDIEDDDALWKSVYWCRDYGVTGVFSERFHISKGDEHKQYRLGALYCVVGFEFTERESDYDKYGETRANEV